MMRGGPPVPQTGNIRASAEAAKVDPTQLRRWIKTGNIPFHTGDRIACTIGLHPLQIWTVDEYLARWPGEPDPCVDDD